MISDKQSAEQALIKLRDYHEEDTDKTYYFLCCQLLEWHRFGQTLDRDPMWVPYALKLTKLLVCGIIYAVTYLKASSSTTALIDSAVNRTKLLSDHFLTK